MNIETENWNRIARYLKGELSDKEKHELKGWIDAKPGNKLLFDQVKKLWITSSNISGSEVDVKKNWTRFLKTITLDEIGEIRVHKINQDLEPTSEPILKREASDKQAFWPVLLRVAAVLVAVALLGFLVNETLLKEDLIVLQTNQEKREFLLPDSSLVYLNSNSKLSYSESFNFDSRVVNLEGEAFFDVKKANGHRFIVLAKNAKAEVFGTSFTVTAYDDEPAVEVKVLTGRVAFSLKDESGTVFLEPGKKGILGKKALYIEEKAIEDPNFLSWKTRKLSFDDSPFEVVVRSLQSHYGAKIIVESADLLKCHYTGSFEDTDLKSTLEVMSAAMDMEFIKEKNAWILSGAGCK